MLRRSITILLLVMYNAMQVAAMPHVHEPGKPGHSDAEQARPHFHLSSHSHHHSHGSPNLHGHHHGHHHDHGQNGSHHSEPTPSQSDDHDSDAVYLNAEFVTSSVVDNRVSVDGPAFVGWMPTPVIDAVTATSQGLGSVDLLEKPRTSCPLYLALRTLRI